jgi:uncharacterized 2Fe-2S/4Fe-4S cluster protein (DUF4445 family)
LDKKSRAKLEHQVRLIEKIETAIEKSFQDEFVAAMALPHQKDDFTNLAAVFNLPVRSNKTSGINTRKRNRRRKG